MARLRNKSPAFDTPAAQLAGGFNDTSQRSEDSSETECSEVQDLKINPSQFLCISLSRNSFTADYTPFHESRKIVADKEILIDIGKWYNT